MKSYYTINLDDCYIYLRDLLKAINMSQGKELEITWKALGLYHKKTNKNILHNLNGSVKLGEFLCIMGQSGAGKSSFLSLLTARITKSTRQFQLEGQIKINDEGYSAQDFGKMAAYVRQDDILMGTLTVEQSFMFQASLKLHQCTLDQQKHKMKEILKKLNLTDCSKVLVGSQFSKCISGGQRKRVTIGLQLLSNPPCLVLDEPTSGLDSYNACIIIKILRELSSEGRIVITTLHQPSTLMFRQLDRLLLLGNGKTLYFDQASNIINYMENLNIQVNYRMNPPDFFMLEVSAFKCLQGYQTPMTATNWQGYSNKIKHNMKHSKFLQSVQSISTQFQLAPSSTQFTSLLSRSIKKYYRTPSNIIGKLSKIVFVPLFMALIYHGIGGRVPEIQLQNEMLDYLHDFTSFIFMIVVFNFTGNLFDATLSFTEQKQIALKQTSAKLYSLFWYFWAKSLVQLPIVIFITIFETSVIYLACQLEIDFLVFSQFCGIMILVSLVGYFIGILTGIIFSTQAQAGQMLPLIMIPMFLFGGLIINLNDVPSYISWLQYISGIRHGYSSAMINQLSTQKLHEIGQNQFIRNYVGINGQLETNIIYLVIMLAISILLSIVIFYLKRKAL